jgi:hypothetical protein
MCLVQAWNIGLIDARHFRVAGLGLERNGIKGLSCIETKLGNQFFKRTLLMEQSTRFNVYSSKKKLPYNAMP